jgi:hypothetical protein
LAGEILSVFVLLLLSSKASGALLGTDSVQSVAFHWESGACFEFLSFFLEKWCGGGGAGL